MKTRVFLGGSIRIRKLDPAVQNRLDGLLTEDYELLVGDADGADLAIQEHLKTRNARSVVVYCTGTRARNNVGEWPTRQVPSSFRPGTREYFTAKDLKMAEDCDYGFLVWDMKSAGTLSNAIELLSRGKHSLVYVAPSRDFLKILQVGHLEELIEKMEARAQSKADSKTNVWTRIRELRSPSALYSKPIQAKPDSLKTHLFISYAVEDAALADWLARKLAAAGYAVWLDRLKLLGGEPWPRSIDVAIKERTFRMLALISQYSLNKPNPSKERTLAVTISRKKGISDFLIPLKVDKSELDWLTTDLNYISFNEGWAKGLRQLLEKLEAIDAPKEPGLLPRLAAKTFEYGADTIVERPEQIFANAMALTSIPSTLSVYRCAATLEDDSRRTLLDDRWASYQVTDSLVVSFQPPPESVGPKNWELVEAVEWKSIASYCEIDCRNIVRNLIERSVRAALIASGVLAHPERKRLYYLNRQYSRDGKLRFDGRNGKRTWCKIEGSTKVIRPGKPAEVVRHLFAFRLRRWHIDEQRTAIQLHPSLVFMNSEGKLITDARAGALRRRLTKSWWNNKWLNRLLASRHIVVDAMNASRAAIQLDAQLMRLEANRAIDESVLSRGPRDSAEDVRQITVEDGEEAELEDE